MSAQTAPVAELSAGETAPAELLGRGEDRFWRWVLVALALHGLLLLAIGRTPPAPRRVGDPAGSNEAVNVEIIDASELSSHASPVGAPSPPAAEPQLTPPPAQPTPQQPVAETAPELKPSKDVPTEAELPEPIKEPVKQAQPKEPSPKEVPAKKPQPKTAIAAIEEDRPDLLALPDLKQPPAPSEQSHPSPREQKTAKAAPKRLTTEPAQPPGGTPIFAAPQSAGMSRPPGITQSGENDEFARRVIRALRQTMPPPRGMFGRVTVRLTLSESGNLAEVKLMTSSGHSALDQDVMFSTKQSSFPLPPPRSKDVDRIFLVTYIYN